MLSKNNTLFTVEQKKFFSCTVYKNYLYCISELEHILMKIDVRNGSVELIKDPKGYDYLGWHLEDKMLAEGEKIYALQLTGKCLMEYSILNNECRYFDINCGAYFYNNYAAFTIYKGNAYIFPSFFNEVVIVNLKSGKINRKKDLYSNSFLKFNKSNELSSIIFTCGCQIENEIWLFMQGFNAIIIYNLDNNQTKKMELPFQIHGCNLAEWRDNVFYILDLYGKLFMWDIYKNYVKCLIEKSVEVFNDCGKIIITQKNIWILPSLKNDIFILDKERCDIEKYRNYPNGFRYEMPNDRGKYPIYTEDEFYYYFPLSSGNFILSIEKSTGKERWICPCWPLSQKRWEMILKRKNFLLKEEIYGLYGYLDILKDIDFYNMVSKKLAINNNMWKIMKGK